jgi:hypothetical protein
VAGGDRSQANAGLIAALLGGLTIEKAAEAAGVSEATARRRLRDPEFVRELNAARREAIAAVAARLAALAGKAVGTLDELMEEAPAPQRIAAAREALRHLAVLAEVADSGELSERIERLERRLGLAAVDEGRAA